MTFHSLRLFCAVAETGSFSVAANRMMVSQSSVSIAVRSLERELGIILFKRTKSPVGNVELTEAGTIVYQLAQEILRLQERLHHIGRSEPGSTPTTIIGTNAPIGVHVLPRLIDGYSKVFPYHHVAVSVEMNYSAIARGLLEGRFDIGIVPNEVTVSSATTLFTFEESLVVVASPKFFQNADRCDIEELELVMPPKSFFTRRKVESYFAQRNIKLKVVWELNLPEAIKQAVQFDRRASILHRVSVEEDIRQGRLVALHPNMDLPTISYKLVVKEQKDRKPHIQELAEYLKRHLSFPRRNEIQPGKVDITY